MRTPDHKYYEEKLETKPGDVLSAQEEYGKVMGESLIILVFIGWGVYEMCQLVWYLVMLTG